LKKGKWKGGALNRQSPNCPPFFIYLFFIFGPEHLPGTGNGLFYQKNSPLVVMTEVSDFFFFFNLQNKSEKK